MRKPMKMQLQIGEIHIADIEFDLKSRDEIPKVLIGLQHIWCNPELREEIFDILKKIIPKGTDVTNGRPGMDLWKILTLGVLRLSCNFDYDKIKEIADNHVKVREMLGHPLFDRNTYPLQTLKDNLRLLTPEALDKINQAVVKAGHKAVGKKDQEPLKAKGDSFVVETNVHYPTDINLLFDAVRKMIMLIASLCSEFGISAWRQSHKNFLDIKRLYNYIRKLKHSTSKDDRKKEEKKQVIIEAHQSYIDLAEKYVKKAKETLVTLIRTEGVSMERINKIREYISHAERQIDQIRRRVIGGETIPHSEKVFSIFEEHTEWIIKGKAGVSQELGVRVCIMEDQYGFILHHQVMEKQTDDKIAVNIVRESQERFPEVRICSFDKGFYTPSNRKELHELLDLAVLPRKGRLSEEDKKVEFSEEFAALRKKHAAVESAINAIENHGLDICPDHGIAGFKRYTALGVLARNLQILGHIIQQKELKRQKRCKKYRETMEKKRTA